MPFPHHELVVESTDPEGLNACTDRSPRSAPQELRIPYSEHCVRTVQLPLRYAEHEDKRGSFSPPFTSKARYCGNCEDTNSRRRKPTQTQTQAPGEPVEPTSAELHSPHGTLLSKPSPEVQQQQGDPPLPARSSQFSSFSETPSRKTGLGR